MNFLIAANGLGPALEQMDAKHRAVIIMALLGLTLVGLFLVVLVMVGGHWVRRQARQRPRSTFEQGPPRSPSNAELRESLQSVLPEAKTDDTIQFGKGSSETKATN